VALIVVAFALQVGNGLAWAAAAKSAEGASLTAVTEPAEGEAALGVPEGAVQPQTAMPLDCQPGQMRCVTQADRAAAAARATALRGAYHGPALKAPLPGGTPDYFGIYPNYANSPLLRKFVDPLPGICAPAQTTPCIPIATKDTTTFPGSDFYQIGLRDYTQQMHSDLPPTQLRGYYDLNPAATDHANHYLGPLIIANRNVPVRIKFTNNLGLGSLGNLFLPVDITYMGAGAGPSGGTYSQNRATLHLHGGVTPWISDGTPHQWITPAGDPAIYKKGVSFQNVPDMVGLGKLIPSPTLGDGLATFYYTNQQSGRLMFYHDHAYGLTRLNVYAGEAAGYLLVDPEEDGLINAGVLPNQGGGVYNYGIPLIIQDKTFVPDAATLAAQDPTWNWGPMGNLWYPHVYMPNQNPADPNGVNAMGRWDYGPWFWPPQNSSTYVPAGRPYPCPTPTSPNQVCPGTPNPSGTPEAFMDTPVVNGAAYPYFQVGRQAYRFRILNAANDRTLNLGLYYADTTVVAPTGVVGTEVKMVTAAPHTPVPPVTTPPTLPLCAITTATDGSGLAIGLTTTPTGLPAGCWPTTWPADGRDGGVPDPATAGPPIIQIGTEGGLLPAPVIIPSTPNGYEYNRRNIVVLNILAHGLLLGPAERADVIIDFSSVPDGSTLILYNDAPAPVPAFDSRIDYYTGDVDQSLTGNATGGAPTTLPGYGPNTRTIMQFRVSGGTGIPLNLAALQAALPAAYATSQAPPVVPETAYNQAFGTTTATNLYSHIQDTSITFTPPGSAVPTTMAFGPKAIQELFTLDYGRMNATLGVELPFTNFNTQTTIPYGYIDPPTEFVVDGVPQIWKITHNGVDTHFMHFHLFNVQVINRVGWDGQIRPPDSNEVGWKETVRMNPLEDIIVVTNPIAPHVPFAVPDSNRLLDVTTVAGTTGQFSNVDPNNLPIVTVNAMTNFGWEYVWHCHILGHEENDMMRPMIFTAKAQMISPPPGTSFVSPSVTFTWSAGAGVTQTYLWVGTTLGGSNLFSNLAGPAKTATVTGVPLAVPIYVRLFSVIGGVSYYTDYVYGPTAKATMISPVAPGPLTGTSVTFTWNTGTGVTSYVLAVGTQPGLNDLASFSGTATTYTATLPATGATIYVRLTSIIGGLPQFVTYTYTEATQVATMISPVPGSTLTAASTTFTWNAVTGVTQYSLWIGSTPGGVDLGNVVLATTSYTATLPITGNPVYVRLWSMIGGVWQSVDYTYTAATLVATMISPAPLSTLPGALVTFTWTAATGATQYSLWIGSTLGAVDLGNVVLATTSYAATLPVKGAAVYVRLWSMIGGVWQFKDYTYTAASFHMITPLPGSALAGTSVTFTWSPITGATQYSLWLGTTVGGTDVANVLSTATSYTATVPGAGATLYARLWVLVGGIWQNVDYTYTEATMVATMTTPIPGTLLSGPSATFNWTAGTGVSQYSVWIGSTPGAADLGNVLLATRSYTAALPATTGISLYVRLWSFIGGTWGYIDYTYTH
jgi:FtsP/CotA-like multicopper oxidase with cupredoxin domain